jgi:uncharacterized protein YciI
MLFSLYCTDKPNRSEVRTTTRPAHVEYLKANIDKIVLGGPNLSDDGQGMIGSLLVIDVADRAAAEAFAANDPYAKAGLFESAIVRPFKKVFP